MKFTKGHKKRGGRTKGTPNKKTVELNLLTRYQPFVDSQEYQDNVRARILRGKAPHMESYLAQRIHGRAVDTVDDVDAQAKPIRVTIQVVRG